MSVSQIVGRTAADLVRAELTKAGPAPPARRSVLVRTLERDEVVELVNHLRDLVLPGCDQPAQLVVSMSTRRLESDPDLSPYAGHGTLTYYRNNAKYGLVLVEL